MQKILIPTGKACAPENYFQQKKEGFLVDSFVVRAQIKSSLMSPTGRKLEIKWVTIRQSIRKAGNTR